MSNRPATVVRDDVPLVEKTAAGDANALRALYDKHASRVMALAYRVLGSKGEAEEIVQETFLEVWRRARDYDAARSAPSTWITTIGRSRAIDRLRSRSSSARTDDVFGVQPVQATPSPLEEVEQRRERERVRQALDELPDEQRRPIELAYYGGLTQKQIAEKDGIPLGTIKTRVRLGLEKLAAAFGARRGDA